MEGKEPTDVRKLDPTDVWVNASSLRELFAVNGLCEDILKRRFRVLDSERRCAHGDGTLHPRIARRGKVISRILFDSIMAVLDDEGKQSDAAEMGMPVGSLILAGALRCPDCEADYRKPLQERLSLAQATQYLYDHLDPKYDDLVRDVSEDAMEEEPSTFPVFVVSRRFVTRFRNSVSGLMRSLQQADAGANFERGAVIESTAEGLDGYGIHSLSYAAQPVKTGDEVDPTVNESILCT